MFQFKISLNNVTRNLVLKNSFATKSIEPGEINTSRRVQRRSNSLTFKMLQEKRPKTEPTKTNEIDQKLPKKKLSSQKDQSTSKLPIPPSKSSAPIATNSLETLKKENQKQKSQSKHLPEEERSIQKIPTSKRQSTKEEQENSESDEPRKSYAKLKIDNFREKLNFGTVEIPTNLRDSISDALKGLSKQQLKLSATALSQVLRARTITKGEDLFFGKFATKPHQQHQQKKDEKKEENKEEKAAPVKVNKKLFSI